jgi:hypothetical protein
MNEKEDQLNPQAEGGPNSDSSHEVSDGPEMPSRRQLIERYAKVAIVGAPLLLFASKAQAIHSKP